VAVVAVSVIKAADIVRLKTITKAEISEGEETSSSYELLAASFEQ
jgi:hypothetical protein